MAGKTYSLTARTNKFKGTAEDDTFNALANKKGKATLTDADVLNGRGGVDTVKAFIVADTLTPNLKNIEKAVFTRTAANDLTLDLAKSASLDTITFDKFASGASVTNATSLATLSVNAMASGKALSVAGIDATKVTTLAAMLTGSTLDLSISAKDAGKFVALNLMLDGSGARFAAPLAADTLTLAVSGSAELKGSAADWLSASKVSVTGPGKLAADLGLAAALTTFDGSAATGDITLTLGGAALTSLKTGTGNDVVTVSAAIAADKSLDLAMGGGTDQLIATLAGKKLTLAGNGGLETLDLTVTGSGSSLAGTGNGLAALKTLTVKGTALSADLGTAAALTSFDASTATGDITLTLGGAALTSLKTGAGNDVVTISGKTAAGGALALDFGAGTNVLKGSAADWLGAKTVTLTGSGNLTTDLGTAAALTSFDGSAATGDITITAAPTLAAMTLKTGAGNDMIKLAAIKSPTLELSLDTGAGQDKLDLTLNNQGVVLKSVTGLETIAIHTSGATTGISGSDTLQTVSGIQTITVDGTAAEFVPFLYPAPWQDLKTINASAFSGKVIAYLNTPALTSLTLGSGDSELSILNLGGTAASKAIIDLGAGNDRVTFANGLGLDHVSVKGGSGFDILFITGNTSPFEAATAGFEGLSVTGATGTYDLSTNSISQCFITSAAGDVTLNGFANGAVVSGMSQPASVSVLDQTQFALTVVMKDAATLTESLSLDIKTSLGSASKGFSSQGLSELRVSASSNNATLFLGAIGAANDAADIVLDDSTNLTLKAVTGATAFIDTITVNGGTLDMLDLAGKSYFAAGGVTITGGAGNDKLATGEGANKVTGGGGLDVVRLLGAAGSDNLNFKTVADSSFGAADTVENFQIALNLGNGIVSPIDTIDVSELNLGTLNFAGNVANEAAGLALLQAGSVKAFFNQATDQLVIDIDKSGTLSGADFAVTLSGINNFTAESLLF